MEPTIAPGTRVGGYVVDRQIGSGGFGEVFSATQPVIGREVAIKILHTKYSSDPSSITRFIAEARAVNQISHPGIIEVFDFGIHEGRHFFVMELLPGRTLRALLDERGPLPLAEALPLLRGIADAVDAAHAAGIAHRDLKPDNVFVLDSGKTKLIDFGISKLVGDDGATLTETGAMLGTPLYMSPEQCRGRATDARTDQYSFGALAYHVLVGEPPFSGDPLEVALHHLNDRPEPPSRRRRGLPAIVDRSILALLAKDPALRPDSCGAAVAALAGSQTLRLKWSRRRKLGIVVAPVAIAGAVATIVMLSTRGASPPVDGCESGADRLAGIWDATVRARVAARFAGGGGSSVTFGHDASKNLDRLADGWSERWDQACAAPDRTTDPLLYGERVTCLENVLLDLRAASDALTTVDVSILVDGAFDGSEIGGRRGRLLADCANERVLRAQVPAPPPVVRDRVTGLSRDGSRAQLEAGIAFSRRDTYAFDLALGRLAAIAKDVEAIDAHSAASLIASSAYLQGSYAYDTDIRRRPAARAALLDAIHRIETSGDNVFLALAYLTLADLELQPGDGDAVAKTVAALAHAEPAVARAGAPILARISLAGTRGQLAIRQGKFAEAIPLLREAAALSTTHTPGAADIVLNQRSVAFALVADGKPQAAMDELLQWSNAAVRDLGTDHPHSTGLTHMLSTVHEVMGDLTGALALRRDASARRDHGSAPMAPHGVVWDRMYQLELEVRMGHEPPDTADTVRKLGTFATNGTPPLQNPDGIATARRAGMFGLFSYAAERTGITGDDEQIDNAAILAFERGDRATMARLAAQTSQRCAHHMLQASCASWIRFSRWLALLADPAKIDAGLTALEVEYPDPFSFLHGGVVLATTGRWSDARAKLEVARAAPNLWEHQADLVELDAWLGLARVHAGDRAGARPLFEEALIVMSILGNGFDGFSYMTPVAERALADILWTASDGDRPRARRLVEHAIKGFARLGSFRDTERLEAERWLAEHR